MRRKWRLQLGTEALVIIPKTDLYPEETATVEPWRIAASLNRWLKLAEANTKLLCCGFHTTVIGRQQDRLTLCPEKLHRGKVKRVKSADGGRERFERPCKHRRRKFDQRQLPRSIRTGSPCDLASLRA